MKIKKLIHTGTFCVLVGASALSLASNIYKWIDDNGTVHYGQNAPLGVKAELISAKTAHGVYPVSEPAPAATAAATTTNTETKAKTAEAPVVVEKDPATCEMAQQNIIELQRPIVRIGGKLMTIDEKNQKIAEMTEIEKVHCP